MAVVTRLPNGYLVITLSPRESVLFNDEILEPGQFPWQSSEAEMISMEIKTQMKNALEQTQIQSSEFLSNVVNDIERRNRAEEEERRRVEEIERQEKEMQRREREGRKE